MQGISWEEYKVIVSNFLKQKKGIYFRGQRNAIWPLETTFSRRSKKNGISLAYYDQVIISQLTRPVREKFRKEFNIKDPHERASFLSLLQHYGFPTPLLDWTLCPYVAAYFAFKDAAKNVKVFVLDTEAWHQYALPIYFVQSPYVHVTAVDPYNAGNSRVIAQKGKFTLSTASTAPDIEEIILKHPANMFNQENTAFIQSITMSCTEKTQATRDLKLLEISEHSLFPDEGFSDLATVCKKLADTYFSRSRYPR